MKSIYTEINKMLIDDKTKISCFFVLAHLSKFYKNLTNFVDTLNDTVYLTFEPENWGSAVYVEIGYNSMSYFGYGMEEKDNVLINVCSVNSLIKVLEKSIIE